MTNNIIPGGKGIASTIDGTTTDLYVLKLQKFHAGHYLTLGNHDIGSVPRKAADARNSKMTNKHFPLETFKKTRHSVVHLSWEKLIIYIIL